MSINHLLSIRLPPKRIRKYPQNAFASTEIFNSRNMLCAAQTKIQIFSTKLLHKLVRTELNGDKAGEHEARYIYSGRHTVEYWTYQWCCISISAASRFDDGWKHNNNVDGSTSTVWWCARGLFATALSTRTRCGTARVCVFGVGTTMTPLPLQQRARRRRSKLR